MSFRSLDLKELLNLMKEYYVEQNNLWIEKALFPFCLHITMASFLHIILTGRLLRKIWWWKRKATFTSLLYVSLEFLLSLFPESKCLYHQKWVYSFTSPLSGTVVFLGDFCIRVTVRETCKKMFIVSGPKWFLVSVSTLLIIGSIMSPVLISSDLRENFQS